jgi:hypothetical protein
MLADLAGDVLGTARRRTVTAGKRTITIARQLIKD